MLLSIGNAWIGMCTLLIHSAPIPQILA